jgi:hypothetical protein
VIARCVDGEQAKYPPPCKYSMRAVSGPAFTHSPGIPPSAACVSRTPRGAGNNFRHGFENARLASAGDPALANFGLT